MNECNCKTWQEKVKPHWDNKSTMFVDKNAATPMCFGLRISHCPFCGQPLENVVAEGLIDNALEAINAICLDCNCEPDSIQCKNCLIFYSIKNLKTKKIL